MKNLLSLILILGIYFNLFGQEQTWYEGEMYLGTENVNPPTQILTFTIEAQGTVWAGSYYPRSYWITDNFDISTYIPHENNEWPPNWWRGWDFVTDPTSNPPYNIPIYAYGIYKLTTNHNSKYFYIDFRDDRYGYYGWYAPPTYGHDIDLWIKYDANKQEFSYNSSSSGTFISISNAQLLNIWEMKRKGQPNNGLFPNYWENCLVVLNNGNDNPRLVWGAYPGFSNNYYNIYKKKGAQDFVLYDRTTSTTYVDLKEEIITGLPQANEGHVYYKVTSVGYPIENPLLAPFESACSNTVDIRIIMPPFDKQEIHSKFKNDYLLFQNYPNPFNPATSIRFNIPEADFVKLILYNILGQEVKTLVNEYKEAGEYTINFSAQDFESGVYIYKLESGKSVQIRKMMLLK